MYPYNISSSLNISGTHQQAFALDLESDNITVWYTLAGSNNSSNSKMRSSKYAADPGDAMEAYFIYTTAYGRVRSHIVVPDIHQLQVDVQETMMRESCSSTLL